MIAVKLNISAYCWKLFLNKSNDSRAYYFLHTENTELLRQIKEHAVRTVCSAEKWSKRNVHTYMKLRKYICTFSITYHKYDIVASVITDTIINYVYEAIGLTESD